MTMSSMHIYINCVEDLFYVINVMESNYNELLILGLLIMRYFAHYICNYPALVMDYAVF
jgi:hypothetical protein